MLNINRHCILNNAKSMSLGRLPAGIIFIPIWQGLYTGRKTLVINVFAMPVSEFRKISSCFNHASLLVKLSWRCRLSAAMQQSSNDLWRILPQLQAPMMVPTTCHGIRLHYLGFPLQQPTPASCQQSTPAAKPGFLSGGMFVIKLHCVATIPRSNHWLPKAP